MAPTGPTEGGSQISSELESRQPAPLSVTVFFLLRCHFRRELVDLVMASNSEPKKTSLYRILTEMA